MGQVELGDGRTAIVHLCATIWKAAIAGDKTFVKILLDRLEGRPPVADFEPTLPETDTLIANSLLQIYGPVSDEEKKAVASEVFEMAKGAVEAKERDL